MVSFPLFQHKQPRFATGSAQGGSFLEGIDGSALPVFLLRRIHGNLTEGWWKGLLPVSYRTIDAETTQLSRVRGGKTTEDYNDPTVQRTIWRHEAVVTGLPEYHGEAEEKVPYQVVSDGAQSEIYTGMFVGSVRCV